jgi:hypothetical protein
VGREADNVAHQFAQFGATLEEERIWTSNFPEFLWPFVLSDFHVT